MDSAFVDGLFDELEKIAASGKGALIGAGLGTGFGALKAVSRETKERNWDERLKATPEEKKKLRRKRLVGHAASVASSAGGGALVGGLHKEIGSFTGKMTKSVREHIQPEVDEFIKNTGKKVSETANKTADDFQPSRIFFRRKPKTS